MNRRLLVPLDGSHLAEVVIPIAETLGRRLKMTVVLLHLVEKGAPAEIHGERHLRNVQDAETYLSGVTSRLIAVGCSVEMHVHEVEVGDVAEGIAAHAS